MATSSKWACLPLFLLASFISLASAARMFPLDPDAHSSISGTSSSSDDLHTLPVAGLKRKLSVTSSQHDTGNDQSSVFTRMDNTAISNSFPDPEWLFEKGEGVMSDEDVGTKNVVDGEFDDEDGSLRHLSDKEINELILDDLEDVGMDNADSGFDDEKCETKECGWSQSNAGSSYGWGWNQGSGSSYGGESGDSGSNESGGGSGGGGDNGSSGGIDGGGGGGGIGGLGGGGGGGGIDGSGGGGDIGGMGWGGGSGGGGGIGWGGGPGGISWHWGGTGNIGGGGNISRDGISIGGGSGRNSWHWGWHWGGGGGKLSASNDPNPNTGASGMSTDTDAAPTPMSN